MVELREFFRVVRYRAVVITLLTAVGVGTAALWLARSPDEYVATTRLFVSGASAASQYEAQQGGVYAQDRVVSYEQLVTSRALAQKTIDALHLNMDAEALAAHITPTSYPDAAVMDVSATADSPRTGSGYRERIGETIHLVGKRFGNSAGQRYSGREIDGNRRGTGWHSVAASTRQADLYIRRSLRIFCGPDCRLCARELCAPHT